MKYPSKVVYIIKILTFYMLLLNKAKLKEKKRESPFK